MRPTSVDRCRALIRLSLSAACAVCAAACLAACGGGGNEATSECARAADRFEQLRVESLRADPALASSPGAAEEHARQTRDVFAKSIATSCAKNREVASCVLASTNFDQASTCR